MDNPSPSNSHISLQTGHPHPKIKPIIGFQSNSKSSYSHQKTHFRTKQISHTTVHRYLSGSSNSHAQNFWFLSLINSKSILHVRFSDYIGSLGNIDRIDFLFKNLQLFRGLRFTLIHPKPEELLKSLKIISKSFVKIHYLISFSFELMNSSKPSEKSLRKLSSLLQTMKNLSYLRISFFSEKDVSENILSLILKENLQKLKSLKSLSLKLVKTSMDTQEIETLCMNLAQCKSLVQMDIEFFGCPNLTNEGIKRLFTTWRDLKLNSLKIKLRALKKNANEIIVYKDFDSLTGEEEQEVPSNFSVMSKYNRQGQKTTLRLVREDLRTKKYRVFELCIFQKKRSEREVLLDFPSSKSLKTLRLDICDYEADDDLTKKLAESFNQMEVLEKLNLEIGSSPKIHDFNSIIQFVKNLQGLKVLELKFKGFNIAEGDLFFHIFQMSSLVALSLDLSECKVSPTVFEIFKELSSSRRSSSLMKFNLALTEVPKEKTEEKLGFLAGVKKIFQKEKQENKRGIEEFWRFLRSLKELRSLNLKLRNVCFSEKDQREFANGLWMLQNLKESQVKLEFDYVEKEKLKIFENFIVKSGRICYLRTLKLQYKEERDTGVEKDVRIYYCKIPSCGLSFQLKLVFRIYFNEARKEIALLKNLSDFMKKNGVKSTGYKMEQRIGALCLICVDWRELESIEATVPADQSPEILGKLVKVILLEGPTLREYSLKIHSFKEDG